MDGSVDSRKDSILRASRHFAREGLRFVAESPAHVDAAEMPSRED